jgi:hypothetical protein
MSGSLIAFALCSYCFEQVSLTYAALRARGVATPELTRDKREAAAWGSRVVARDIDRGSQGRGITIYQRGAALGDHLFYTRYHKKEREFRFHVVNGKVIFVQEKLRKRDAGDNYDRYVRSHDRGWCFAFKHLDETPPPQALGDLAVSAVGALGLDFGACDIGWNDRHGGSVFEVNTAPGIEDTSLQAYTMAFLENYGA